MPLPPSVAVYVPVVVARARGHRLDQCGARAAHGARTERARGWVHRARAAALVRRTHLVVGGRNLEGVGRPLGEHQELDGAAVVALGLAVLRDEQRALRRARLAHDAHRLGGLLERRDQLEAHHAVEVVSASSRECCVDKRDVSVVLTPIQ